MFDVTTGQATQVAQHDAPIKVVAWVDAPQAGILATGSWDKTIKYWDLRTPSPVATVQLPERCYTFDVQYPLMVVGTAERHIQIFNLTNPNTAYKVGSAAATDRFSYYSKYSDHPVPFEVANTGCFLFHCVSEQWLRRG